MSFEPGNQLARAGQHAIRAERFDVQELDVQLLARANNMRFNCFWLKVLNLSSKGLLMTCEKGRYVTFRVGDELKTTMDLSSRVFQRPVHIRFKVVRELVYQSERAWGLELIEIEDRHSEVFLAGFDTIRSKMKPTPTQLRRVSQIADLRI